MTKKDFEAIAAAVRQARRYCEICLLNQGSADIAINEVVNRLCNALRNSNLRFDQVRFIEACNLREDE